MKIRIGGNSEVATINGSDLMVSLWHSCPNNSLLLCVPKYFIPIIGIKKEKITVKKEYGLEKTIIKK
jgi:hypothetical protein